MTKAKETSKSLKKKTEEKNVATVAGAYKPNKHHSYFKAVVDEKSGVASIKFKDGKNHFFTGTHDTDLINNTINQVTTVCCRGEGLSSERVDATNAALASIIEIDPQHSTELMLAAQVAAVGITLCLTVVAGITAVNRLALRIRVLNMADTPGMLLKKTEG